MSNGWIWLSQMSFEWPWAFLLLPLPFFLKPLKSQSLSPAYAPKTPFFEPIKALGIGTEQESHSRSVWKKLVLFLAWLSLVIACSRPTLIGEQVEIPLSGRDLMLAIDISPSMQEVDLQLEGRQATRLQVVKSVVSNFVDERQGDRLGLILFGSEPYVQSPLSFDTITVNKLLQEAFIGMAGQATAIGDAVALGVKRLRSRPENSRVLILLSDGANTAGEIPPEKAAQLAAQEKIKIYTIGVGADEMLKRSFFGSRRVNPSSDLDEGMLQLIAQTTNGQYFRARSSEELENIYQIISELEPVEQETRSFRPIKSLMHYFLGLAMAIFALYLLFRFILGLPFYKLTRSKHLHAARSGEEHLS